jgi:hypothetical protein
MTAISTAEQNHNEREVKTKNGKQKNETGGPSHE